MALSSDSFRFFAHSDLVEATGGRTLGSVLTALDKTGQGAVLLKRGKRAVAMARVDRLLEHGMDVAGPKSVAGVRMSDIASALIADPDVVWVPGVDVDVAHDAATLRAREGAVFAVTEGGSSIGYYMNHEAVREILTRPPIYVCDQGHENKSYNGGWCSIGPHPIVEAK